ncbi:hypothetical protein HanIR_Chr17g0859371 [Helianthus annuus]|nr:hypothetical protein HanIR_Chr17g0859371 [Helianthus annuus]
MLPQHRAKYHQRFFEQIVFSKGGNNRSPTNGIRFKQFIKQLACIVGDVNSPIHIDQGARNHVIGIKTAFNDNPVKSPTEIYVSNLRTRLNHRRQCKPIWFNANTHHFFKQIQRKQRFSNANKTRNHRSPGDNVFIIKSIENPFGFGEIRA